MLARVPSTAAWFSLLPRRLRAPASRSAMATTAASLHHVFVPAKTRVSGRPPPLVVLLHGTGADEHDLLDAGEQLQQAFGGELAVASLRAPLSLGYGGYAWFEGYSFAPERRALEHTVRGAAPKGQQRRTDAGPELFALTDSASRVIAFLEAAPATLGTDPERTALFCFSQGATIGWTVSTSVWPRPGLLKGACLLRCARCCEQNGCVCAAHLTLLSFSAAGCFQSTAKRRILQPATLPPRSCARAPSGSRTARRTAPRRWRWRARACRPQRRCLAETTPPLRSACCLSRTLAATRFRARPCATLQPP